MIEIKYSSQVNYNIKYFHLMYAKQKIVWFPTWNYKLVNYNIIVTKLMLTCISPAY